MVDFSRDGVFAAESEAERAAVYRLRYDIYVVEMDRYKSVADHPEDDRIRLPGGGSADSQYFKNALRPPDHQFLKAVGAVGRSSSPEVPGPW